MMKPADFLKVSFLFIQDILCIHHLIIYYFNTALVKAKWNKLSDGTTKKNVIWEDVGEEMNKNGYQTSEGNKSGVICSQKWNNMLNTYKNFTLLVEKTGSGADVLDMKPLLYGEIQEILGRIFLIIS